MGNLILKVEAIKQEENAMFLRSGLATVKFPGQKEELQIDQLLGNGSILLTLGKQKYLIPLRNIVNAFVEAYK